MISFFVGLFIVAVLGAAVTKHIRNNPDTLAQYLRAQKQANRPADKRTGPSRTWVVTKATGAMLWRAGQHFSPREREIRRMTKVREAHEKAKASGDTAATVRPEAGLINDKRGLKGAWADLKDNLYGTKPEVPESEADTGPVDTVVHGTSPTSIETTVRCPQCGAPHTTNLTNAGDEKAFSCVCGFKLKVFRRPDADPADITETSTETTASRPEEPRKGIHMTNLVQLFETGDMLANPVFEHVFQIERFTLTLAEASGDASAMYFNLATRMEGPMSIDPIVTEPIRRCGTHQIQIQSAVKDAGLNLGHILSATTAQLLERGIRVPKPELLNGDSQSTPHIPSFFDTVKTVAGRSYGDVREVHCLIKGLRIASEHQTVMYKKTALKLQDENVDASVVEQYLLAARHQEAISMALADGDANMTKLLTMTVRELAASSLRAPNANLIGV